MLKVKGYKIDEHSFRSDIVLKVDKGRDEWAQCVEWAEIPYAGDLLLKTMGEGLRLLYEHN